MRLVVRKTAGRIRIDVQCRASATGAIIMGEPSEQAKAIFLEAIEQHEAEDWPAFLEQACTGDSRLRAEVEELLRARTEMGSFHEPPRPAPVATVDEPTREAAGTVIGPYKLIQEIAAGGMGTVWMAQQSLPVKRLVALKVIKPGMDSRQVIARFEAERQALALMDHPNIAQRVRRRHDHGWPAVLRHGAGQGRAHHQVLRRAPADAEGAARAVHPGVPGHPARPPEGHHPPGHQALQRAGRAVRRQARAQGDRLRHRQGDGAAADRAHAVHRLRRGGRHAAST